MMHMRYFLKSNEIKYPYLQSNIEEIQRKKNHQQMSNNCEKTNVSTLHAITSVTI